MPCTSPKQEESEGWSWKFLHSLPLLSLLSLDLSAVWLQSLRFTCCHLSTGRNILMNIWKQYPLFHFKICAQILGCLLLVHWEKSLIHGYFGCFFFFFAQPQIDSALLCIRCHWKKTWHRAFMAGTVPWEEAGLAEVRVCFCQGSNGGQSFSQINMSKEFKAWQDPKITKDHLCEPNYYIPAAYWEQWLAFGQSITCSCFMYILLGVIQLSSEETEGSGTQHCL